MAATSVSDATTQQEQYKIGLELDKVSDIRNKIEQHQMLWFADTNSISNLTYSQKKSLFGDNYNICGLDYYVGGIFDSEPNAIRQQDNSELVPDFDWRNRHGADDPAKLGIYYDGDELGSGWLTSVRNQGEIPQCDGLCYIYGALGAVEGVANIYFNQHWDYHLSVQNVLECIPTTGDPCGGGIHSDTYTKLKAEINYGWEGGVSNTAYYPRDYPLQDCEVNVYPENYLYTFKIENYEREPDPPIINRIDDLKTMIIEKGPLSVRVYGYGSSHIVALVGWGTLKVGDYIFPSDISGAFDPIPVLEGSNYIGLLYWINKNSWGADWGDNGYAFQLDSDAYPRVPLATILPITFDGINDPAVACNDLDKDGYYNWGIGPRPDNDCPDTELDSDDSEPRIGPFDDNYFGVPVAPIMEVERIIDMNTKDIIPNNSFYSFYNQTIYEQGGTITLAFNVVNNGNAQLNLDGNEYLDINITISGENASNYEAISYPHYYISKNEFSPFELQFTVDPLDVPKIATITIGVNESDMYPFIFYLVFTNCPNPTEIVEVTDDESWNTPALKFNDVLVKDNATLTITSDIAFVTEASLFIQKGSTVIIDGGHITSLCNLKWQGVDVWGDINRSQFHHPPEDKLKQGKIKIINGGKISLAENAIETIRYIDDEPDPATSGGIVYINNGSIENCTRSVVFYPYKNFYPDPRYPRQNWSSFYKASFYNDHYPPEAQVYFNEVDGVIIKGSCFENKVAVSPWFVTRGIYSYNSGFRVSEIIMPNPDDGSIKTTFNGFDHGIYALAGRLAEYISIRSSVFEDNKRGIYLSSIKNAVIVQNEFLVRDKYSKHANSTELIGLYMDGLSTGFTVEENTFYTNIHYNNLETELCNGITINNSGQQPNELYNNFFNNLTVGIAAGGLNRSETGEGLCMG